MTALAHPPVKHRLGPVTTARHCLTLGGRNLRHLKANPGEIIGFAVVQPLMVIALLVYVFGGAIAGDTATYLQYALPGLIVQSSVTSVLATGTGLHQDISNGLFDRLRSLPIARIAPLMGHLIGTMVRVSAGLLMLLAVGAAQGFEVHTGVWATLAGLLLITLFSAGLAWLSMLVGLAAKSATTVHMLTGMLAIPLTFCSNVFVKTSTMPGWLQTWADINPISQEATALRSLLTGGPIGDSVWWTVGWTVVMTAVFAPLSIQAYRRRV
ncbi:ABC transporter permease [Streptomyces sp. NBC_00316]|uniref:ABC transporter permease n=1 Tax=Streptomyces sp. NBC_00316 TaxID=2975710 RepID=UPI002E2A4B47|nr:ABC transporter permease [Streptomyces sp. NBC_00316]